MVTNAEEMVEKGRGDGGYDEKGGGAGGTEASTGLMYDGPNERAVCPILTRNQPD